MHEHGIADELMKRLLEAMREHGATRIIRATVHVGEFSGITEEALCAALEHCAEHEGMAPFPVEVMTVGPMLRCCACGEETPLDDAAACSSCGSEDVELIPATGVTIREVELA